MSAAAASAKPFVTEEAGHGQTRHWLVRLAGRRECIGVVETRAEQFVAFHSGRWLGLFSTVDEAAEACMTADAMEAAR